MEDLNYYDLDALVNKCVEGELDIHKPLEITNKLRNKRHEVSFLHHLLVQCKTLQRPLIVILSILRHRIKGRLLQLINDNAFIRHYIQSIIYEWSLDISPADIFVDGLSTLDEFMLDGEENLFDYDKLIGEKKACQRAGGLLITLEKDIGENQFRHVPFNRAYSSDIEDRMRDIHTQCYDCMSRVRQNIQEVDTKYSSLEPKHIEVLLDMSTKCRSEYLEHSARNDESSIAVLIADKNGVDIPENIHTIFLNYILVLNMIQKEMKYILTNFQKLMEDVQSKTLVMSRYMDGLSLDDFMDDIPDEGEEGEENVDENPLPTFIQDIIDKAKAGSSFFD